MGFFMILIPIGVFVVAFFFIASVAFSTFRKAKKTVNKSIPVIEQRFNDNIAKVVMVPVAKQEDKVCEYCGSTIPNGVTECESCGAKVKKQKH